MTDTDAVTLEILTEPARLKKPRRIPGRVMDDTTLQTHATTTDADGWEHYAWTVRLHYQGRSMDSPWRAGTGHTLPPGRRMAGAYERPIEPKPPTAADLLESLIMDASSYTNARNFEEWAADYGMDTDSRKAEALYRQCGELTRELERLLGGRPWEKEPYQDAEELAAELAGTREKATP